MSTTEKWTAACISMNSKQNVKENINHAIDLIKEAKSKQANLIVLPEMFTFIGSSDHYKEVALELEKSQLKSQLQKLALDLNIHLLTGSFPETNPSDTDKVYNSSYFISSKGEIIANYRKVHLFKIAPIDHQPAYDETVSFCADKKVCSFSYQQWNIGISICFDLRFSALYRQIASINWPHILFVPSAFTYLTGKDHWQILLQSRAVEWQTYVLAANQVGEHADGKRSYGHSMIIDPWGNIIAQTKDAIGIAIAEISMNRIKEVKKRLDMQLCQVF